MMTSAPVSAASLRSHLHAQPQVDGRPSHHAFLMVQVLAEQPLERHPFLAAKDSSQPVDLLKRITS